MRNCEEGEDQRKNRCAGASKTPPFLQCRRKSLRRKKKSVRKKRGEADERKNLLSDREYDQLETEKK